MHRAGLRRRLALPWRERRLPVNVDPLESRLSDQAERERLARVFEQGLGTSSATCCRSRRSTDGEETALAQRPLVLPPGADVSDSRRFADGLAVAARFAALGRPRPIATMLIDARSRWKLGRRCPSGAHSSSATVASGNGQRRLARGSASSMARGAAGWRRDGAGIVDRAGDARISRAAPARRVPYLATGQSARGLIRTALCVEPRKASCTSSCRRSSGSKII